MYKDLLKWMETAVALKRRMEVDQKKYKEMTAFILEHASEFTEDDVEILNMGLDMLESWGLDNVEEVYTMGQELRRHGHTSGGLTGGYE